MTEEKKEPTFLQTLFGGVIALVLSPLIIVLFVPIMLLRGWVLSVLWGWFVVPTLAGVPVLSVVQAIGLSLVFTFMSPTNWGEPKNKNMAWLWPFYAPLMALIVGWFVQRWM